MQTGHIFFSSKNSPMKSTINPRMLGQPSFISKQKNTGDFFESTSRIPSITDQTLRFGKRNALHEAIAEGNETKLRKELLKKAKPKSAPSKAPNRISKEHYKKYNKTSKSHRGTTSTIDNKSLKINEQNDYGNAPLHIAIIKDQEWAIPILLAQPGIDVNIKNGSGNTALHLAILKDIQEKIPGWGAIPILLTHPGIRLDIENNNGNTAKGLFGFVP